MIKIPIELYRKFEMQEAELAALKSELDFMTADRDRWMEEVAGLRERVELLQQRLIEFTVNRPGVKAILKEKE